MAKQLWSRREACKEKRARNVREGGGEEESCCQGGGRRVYCVCQYIVSDKQCSAVCGWLYFGGGRWCLAFAETLFFAIVIQLIYLKCQQRNSKHPLIKKHKKTPLDPQAWSEIAKAYQWIWCHQFLCDKNFLCVLFRKVFCQPSVMIGTTSWDKQVYHQSPTSHRVNIRPGNISFICIWRKKTRL